MSAIAVSIVSEEAGAMCARLFQLTSAQLAALESDDFDNFLALSAERTAVQEDLGEALRRADPDSQSALRGRLRRVELADAQLLESAQRLLDTTASELRDLHRGRSALRGYGRVGLPVGSVRALVECEG